MIGRAILGAILLAAGLSTPLAAATATPTELRVTIGGTAHTLELALDDEARVHGLSGRLALAPDGGMLFIFPRAELLVFWMKDCYIPLDLLFLDEKGRLIAAATMAPEPRLPGEDTWTYEQRLTRHPSGAPARFAIELAAGTAAKAGIRIGDLLLPQAAELIKLAR